MEAALLGLAAMHNPSSVTSSMSAKRGRVSEVENKDLVSSSLVSSSLRFIAPYEYEELTPAARQRAQAEARAVVRGVDKLLEQLLDVRIITTHRDTAGGVELRNLVNLRVSQEYSCMIHHERASATDGNLMFCFMASSELEPVVVLVLLHEDHGRLVHLKRAHFDLLELALREFAVRYGLKGETYSYTPLKARLGCSWHSRHFHLKIRIPTEMYLRIFPVMQVLGGNHGCKRNLLEPYKKMWEPLQYKFELKAQLSWPSIRSVVLQDVSDA